MRSIPTYIVTIPLTALGLVLFWLKMRSLVRQMTCAIDAHRIKLLGEPHCQFHGIEWGRCRVFLLISTSWLDVAGDVALVVMQSMSLDRAFKRSYEEPAGRHLGTDQLIVILLALVVAAAVVSLASMAHGAYTVTLLCGYWRCPKRCCGRWSAYPLAVYQDSHDPKPVYLR